MKNVKVCHIMYCCLSISRNRHLSYLWDKNAAIVNPLVKNGISHPIIWSSPLSFLGALGYFFICISVFDKIHESKQNSPRWDAAFCGVTSGAILFAYVPLKGRQAYMG